MGGEVVLLVLGALLGIVLDRIATLGHAHWRSSNQIRTQARFQKGRSPSVMSPWIVAYYQSKGDPLYVTTHTEPGMVLPLLVEPALNGAAAGYKLDPELLTFIDSDVKRFEVNERLITAARLSGRTIFDGELAMLNTWNGSGDKLHLSVTRCSYLSFASRLLTIESEVARACIRPKARTPVLDQTLGSWDVATGPQGRPLAVGCSVVTLLSTTNGLVLPIQTRSSAVVAHGGVRAVVPTFGIEPHIRGGMTSKYPCLTYNFLKEFAEELFDYEEVIHASRSSNLGPDWILGLGGIDGIESEMHAGRMLLTVEGICLEPRGAALQLALLARFTSIPFCDDLIGRLRSNWESGPNDGVSEGSPALELVGIDDARLDEWTRDGVLGPSSTYAIDCARRCLASER
jgi:hypothetical protein